MSTTQSDIIVPVTGAPHPPEVRATISDMVREYSPHPLTFTVNWFAGAHRAVVLARLREHGRMVEAREVAIGS
jgi:hypothetical protein